MTGRDGGRTDSSPSTPPQCDAPVRLPPSTLHAYQRFSLYNSPYPAHDTGCAIDLYPAGDEGFSPVAGEVVDTQTVRAPPKPYAADEEFLILVDVDAARSGLDVSESGTDDLVARILHVRPAVEPGDVVAVGDFLGTMVRSGFFAPWVGNHVHLGFRRAGQNFLRADGSVPLSVNVDIEPLPWDGVGTVVETRPTYALLDAPSHPAPGDRFAGIAGLVVDAEASPGGGRRSDGTPAVLDGGFAHYAGGGLLGRETNGGRSGSRGSTTRPVRFLDHHVGDVTGRDVSWRDVDVVANGSRITGLSLFVARDSAFGAKLVCPDRAFSVGERVRVTVRDSDDPIRLG